VPICPVCGIELDEDMAIIHEHDGKKFHFCCNGCRRIFVKKPRRKQKIQKFGKILHA